LTFAPTANFLAMVRVRSYQKDVGRRKIFRLKNFHAQITQPNIQNSPQNLPTIQLFSHYPTNTAKKKQILNFGFKTNFKHTI
jgi:hypothetical protein